MKKAKKFTIISCLLLVLCMTGNAHRSLAKQRIKTEQKKGSAAVFKGADSGG